MAKTRFVGVTDDDCFVDAKWVEHMCTLLAEDPYTVVTGRVLTEGEGGGVITVASMTPKRQTRPSLTYDSLSGGNLGASEDVFSGAGLFDEDPRLRMAEDAEWAYRVLRAGFAITYSPDLLVRHVAWRDEKEQERQYGDYARSHGGFYGKYLRKGDVFIGARACVHLITALRRWVRGSLARDASEARIGRAYAMGLLPGILRALRGPVSE
jgi:GT2 family glycosyltransferase